MWRCPNCKEDSEDNYDVCWNCQYEREDMESATLDTLDEDATEEHISEIQNMLDPILASPKTVEHKYAALRGIASLCSALGYLMLGLGGVGVLGGVIIMNESAAAGFSMVIVAIIFSAVTYVFFRVIAEGILVTLDIEANTRQTAINSEYVRTIREQRLRD